MCAMCSESAQSKTAFVTFKDAKALEIALLLSVRSQIDFLSIGIDISVSRHSESHFQWACSFFCLVVDIEK